MHHLRVIAKHFLGRFATTHFPSAILRVIMKYILGRFCITPLVCYTQDKYYFSTELYSREREYQYTGIQTLKEKANVEAGYERGAILHLPQDYGIRRYKIIENK